MRLVGWIVQLVLVIVCIIIYNPLSMIFSGLISSLSIYVSVFEEDRYLMIVSLINTCWMIIGGFILLSYTT